MRAAYTRMPPPPYLIAQGGVPNYEVVVKHVLPERLQHGLPQHVLRYQRWQAAHDHLVRYNLLSLGPRGLFFLLLFLLLLDLVLVLLSATCK